MNEAKVLIAGAGPAGLALAGCLKRAGVNFVLLEKQDRAANTWRGQYDRLHLHTPKSISALPYLPFKPSVPRYPSRDDFTAYLDDYCTAFGIRAVCATEVISALRKEDSWSVQTSGEEFRVPFLALATGLNSRPRLLTAAGIGSFTGGLLHSAHYQSGRDFKDRKVLVVGFGNSAGEIAMDLCDHGVRPVVSVRSPGNVIPLNLLGIPVLHWARWLSVFGGTLSDRLSAPLRRLAMGDLQSLGIEKPAYGPAVQVGRFGKIPLIDTGTIRYVRQGKIRIAPGIESVNGDTVYFTGGGTEQFDDIIAATGYETGLPELVGVSASRLADLRLPLKGQTLFGSDGLYGSGFRASGTGMIRAIGIEAKRISEDIVRRLGMPLAVSPSGKLRH